MRLWFYLGDVFEWLDSGKKMSGVQRITVEFFLTAIVSTERLSDVELIPCVFSPSSDHLTSISLADATARISHGQKQSSDPAVVSHAIVTPLLFPVSSPKKGDHILFTGLVWTPTHTDYFRQLRAAGTDFSVFVYDIIPIERTDLVSAAYHQMFSDWLKVVVATARNVFVSSGVNEDLILKWAVLAGVRVTARIVPISFGAVELAGSRSNEEIPYQPRLQDLKSGHFVLSVGTIDKRKNQSLLVRVWSRLIAENKLDMPRLVLAGRNELSLAAVVPMAAQHIAAGRILIVEDASDALLAHLYRHCLFTAFPSLIEGYGLPVSESLTAGKLCIASDLPVIREFAGDLIWYFDPAADAAAYDLVRLAIERPELRRAAETRIAQEFKPVSWISTFESMIDAIRQPARSPN